MSSDLHVFYNGSGTSVVIDAAGHSLDAEDRIEGSPRNAHLSRLVEAGVLTDLGAVDDVVQVEAEALAEQDEDDTEGTSEDDSDTDETKD